MNRLTKLALGWMGPWRPVAAVDAGAPTIELPPPRTRGGNPPMQALSLRASSRALAPRALPPQRLADLLWAAAGVNRAELGGRTAPSAMDAPRRAR